MHRLFRVALPGLLATALSAQLARVHVSSAAGDRIAAKPPIRFTPARTAAAIPVFRIDPSVRRQTILGFGASFLEAGMVCLNSLDARRQEEVLRYLFHPTEGAGFSGGVVDGDEPRGFNFEVDHGYFERVVWPALAHRFPPLEAARCHRTWAGLYEQCELDGNPIIGRWTSRLGNLYTVAGFSGHGMMHAPAAGRAIAELITHGRFETIDLSRLGYERVEANAPYTEVGIL